MLENGVNEDVVDGFLKEAEEIYKEAGFNFGGLFKGIGGLAREAEGIGVGLKGMATGEGIVGRAAKPGLDYFRNVANEYRGGLNGIPKEVPHGVPGEEGAAFGGETTYKGMQPNGSYKHPNGDVTYDMDWTTAKQHDVKYSNPVSGANPGEAGSTPGGVNPPSGGVAGATGAAEAATRAKPGFMGPGLVNRRLARAGQGAMWGAGLGAIGGIPGMIAGGALGAGAGALGRVGVGALGAGALLGGGSLLGAGGRDRYGLPNDRNRLLPFMNNNLTGALGGGIAGLVAENAGVPGGALLPLIGAAGGYHFLPQIMNNTGDPLGSGANSVQYPLMHSGQ